MGTSGKDKGRQQVALNRLLAERFPHENAEKLFAHVMCGQVKVNGERIRNHKQRVAVNSEIIIEESGYVSRGGYKLEAALDDFGLDVKGKVCLDAGASTGGFTDCLLSRGAKFVHAVDVGYNQLAWKLRSNPKVKCRERTNLMSLQRGDLEPVPSLAVADLSFRSLRGAASRLLDITGGGVAVVLVKPQFEGVVEAGFNGVVKTHEARRRAVNSLVKDLAEESVFVRDAAASPIRGRKGNVELFLLLTRQSECSSDEVAGRIEEVLKLSL